MLGNGCNLNVYKPGNKMGVLNAQDSQVSCSESTVNATK